MDKIKYFAAPGRQLPIEQDLATAPGGGLLMLGDADAGGNPVLLDPTDGRVIRMIAAGDIVPADLGEPVIPPPSVTAPRATVAGEPVPEVSQATHDLAAFEHTPSSSAAAPTPAIADPGDATRKGK